MHEKDTLNDSAPGFFEQNHQTQNPPSPHPRRRLCSDLHSRSQGRYCGVGAACVLCCLPPLAFPRHSGTGWAECTPGSCNQRHRTCRPTLSATHRIWPFSPAASPADAMVHLMRSFWHLRAERATSTHRPNHHRAQVSQPNPQALCPTWPCVAGSVWKSVAGPIVSRLSSEDAKNLLIPQIVHVRETKNAPRFDSAEGSRVRRNHKCARRRDGEDEKNLQCTAPHSRVRYSRVAEVVDSQGITLSIHKKCSLRTHVLVPAWIRLGVFGKCLDALCRPVVVKGTGLPYLNANLPIDWSGQQAVACACAAVVRMPPATEDKPGAILVSHFHTQMLVLYHEEDDEKMPSWGT